jgi:hypothetical protein
MKFSLTGLAFLVMGAFPQATYAQAPPGQPYIQIPIPYSIPGAPRLPRRRAPSGGSTFTNGGSTVSTLDTKNTSYASGWPIRRPTLRSEKD